MFLHGKWVLHKSYNVIKGASLRVVISIYAMNILFWNDQL